MAKYYSKDAGFRFKPFEGAVEITDEYYSELLSKQGGDVYIDADETGYPVLKTISSSAFIEQHIRQKRNNLLASTDWTQLADVPKATKDLYKPYRQALRDIPQQSGFPNFVEWPSLPK